MQEPPDEIDLDWVRAEIVRRARNKNLRTVEFTPDRPSHWSPRQVMTPEFGLPFTDVAAWQFIAEQAESGAKIEVIPLENPPGSVGYVMTAVGGNGKADIYIKIELGGDGGILGRSFHYSER